MDYMWMNSFSRDPGEENIATSIDADKFGDVYVTGYCYTTGNGYDFATIKYNGSNGGYAWQNEPVLFYDMGNGNDKASSIKVFGDSIYVAGSSQFFPGGYRTLAYRQNNGNVELNWDNFYIPSFLNDERNLVNRASLLNIDTTTGNVIAMMMAWDNYNISKYAVIGYSGSGNTLYTIDYGDSNSDQLKNNKTKEANNHTFDLAQNYPNPFNPATIIRYSLPDDRFVDLKVYNMLGKEVSSLVNEKQTAGNYEVTFDGSNLSSGIYYYTMSANGKVLDTKRMILMK
ncbi:MAG: T9SS type A sorting domain-containing protein [Ignavibacteria bacterium]|nr:T9SS type A sorting domain-containing protein [Ignavibacteria bacterium]